MRMLQNAMVLMSLGLLVGLSKPAVAHDALTPEFPNSLDTGLEVDAALVNKAFGLESSSLEAIDVSAQDGVWRAELTLDGIDVQLELRRVTVRAPGYELRVQSNGGRTEIRASNVDQSLRGRVVGVPESGVAGVVDEHGLTACVWMAPDRWFWVEPVRKKAAGPPGLHVVYEGHQTTPGAMTCGNLRDEVAPLAFRMREDESVSSAVDRSVICQAEIAIDADFEFFVYNNRSVTEVESQVTSYINMVNMQYELQTGITHMITEIIVRESEEDPYMAEGGEDLLCEMIDEWNDNQQDVERDLALLFTGRDFRSPKGLVADIGDICEPLGLCVDGKAVQGAYGYAKLPQVSVALGNSLIAHELGHLWNAQHCNCSEFTMFFNAPASVFTPTTVEVITNYVDVITGPGADCIECGPLLELSLPNGDPVLVDPCGTSTIHIDVAPGIGTPVPNTGMFIYRINGGVESELPMTVVDADTYEATFPATDCGDVIEYYFTVSSSRGTDVHEPLDAPVAYYSTIAGTSASESFADNFEVPQGWTVENSPNLVDGAWDFGVPVDCDRGDPPADSDGSGACALTDNSAMMDCNSDVDGGETALVSPVMNASDAERIAMITYDRWITNSSTEIFRIDVSDDSGSTWVSLETLGPFGEELDGGWFRKSFRVTDAGIAANDQFRIRFRAEDPGFGQLVEAGIDAVRLLHVDCPSNCCTADVTSDGVVNVEDLTQVILDWGRCSDCEECPSDIDGDCDVGVTEMTAVILEFGMRCPE